MVMAGGDDQLSVLARVAGSAGHPAAMAAVLAAVCAGDVDFLVVVVVVEEEGELPRLEK